MAIMRQLSKTTYFVDLFAYTTTRNLILVKILDQILLAALSSQQIRLPFQANQMSTLSLMNANKIPRIMLQRLCQCQLRIDSISFCQSGKHVIVNNPEMNAIVVSSVVKDRTIRQH